LYGRWTAGYGCIEEHQPWRGKRTFQELADRVFEGNKEHARFANRETTTQGAAEERDQRSCRVNAGPRTLLFAEAPEVLGDGVGVAGRHLLRGFRARVATGAVYVLAQGKFDCRHVAQEVVDAFL